MEQPALRDFDALALFDALDERRASCHLSWQGAASAMWALSSELNRTRGDHPVSPSTLTGLRRRHDTSCQHALFMLRWLDAMPEAFLVGDLPALAAPLPPAGPDRRPRWRLSALSDAVISYRVEHSLTWKEMASLLRCTPHQLTGLKTARFATSMNVAMKIAQLAERPAASFIYAARW
jgi:hypothetical protein